MPSLVSLVLNYTANIFKRYYKSGLLKYFFIAEIMQIVSNSSIAGSSSAWQSEETPGTVEKLVKLVMRFLYFL